MQCTTGLARQADEGGFVFGSKIGYHGGGRVVKDNLWDHQLYSVLARNDESCSAYVFLCFYHLVSTT